MANANFILMTPDEHMEVEGGSPVILPVLKGIASVIGIIRGAITIHNFLEDVVEDTAYSMAYEAEIARLRKENSVGQ